MRITRRHLQLSLAGLWLFDAALQCQPSMFTRAVTRAVIAPIGQGQPSVLAGPLHLLTAVVSAQPALVNATFALIQFTLGLGILTRRFTRVALGASIVWALSVWTVGEGFGGLTSGATLLTGAPGAALLYAVIAVLAWPTRSAAVNESPSSWALPAWCALWLTGAGLQLVAGNNSATSITKTLQAAGSGSPRWIGGIDYELARLTFPAWSSAVAVALYVLVAMWALIPGRFRQLSVAIGVVIAFAGWLVVQGLGDVTSGHATDLNSGPLIFLMAFAVLGATYSRESTQASSEVVVEREGRLLAPLMLDGVRRTAGGNRVRVEQLVAGSARQ